MSRRVSLPGAAELFGSSNPVDAVPAPIQAAPAADHDSVVPGDDDGADRRGSGRVKHDEKMTVYVTADELLDLEHARLTLRRHLGVGVDRGRLVREAIAIVLADYELRGDDSALVQRLVDA